MYSLRTRSLASYWPVLAVAVCSITTRFIWYGYPKAAVIDEVYFSQYLSSYLTGHFYFDLHPPLGKLLVALFAKLNGVAPVPLGTPWNIDYEGTDYLYLRFLPGVFGAALPVLFYAVALRVFGDRRLSLLAGLCAAFDNALITQSRFLFFDVFLLDFGLASLLAYLAYKRTHKLGFLFAAGVCAGCAASVKWVALTFVLLPAALDYLALVLDQLRLRDVLRTFACVTTAAASTYALVFALHFALLPDSGPGDAFMSPAFQKSLAHSAYAEDPNVVASSPLARFIELQRVMFQVNDHVGDHPYGSPWYGWPLNRKGVGYFRRDSRDIVLVGNDVLWWMSSAAVALLVVLCAGRPRLLREPALSLIVVGYLSNWLPFMAIRRVMFLHHYLVALLFSVLALCYCVGRVPWLVRHTPYLFAIVFVGYVAQMHFTYGVQALFWQ